MMASAIGDDIFVHFLEHEILALVGRRDAYGVDAERAFRISLVLAERTVVPATAYWEDRWAAPLLEAYAPFRHAGRLKLIGTAPSPQEYLATKREHYAREPARYTAYFNDPTRAEYERLSEMWRMRNRSTTADIAASWRAGVRDVDPLFERLLHAPVGVPNIDGHLFDVPELLGPDAFIRDFVIRALGERRVFLDQPRRSIVGEIILRDYVRSHLLELGGTALVGGPTSAVDGLLSDAPFAVDLTRVTSILNALDMAAPLAQLDARQMLRLRLAAEWEPVRMDILARAGRTGEIWSSEEMLAIRGLTPMRPREPLESLRNRCASYAEALGAVARQRLIEEADLEGKRQGQRIVAGHQSVVVTGDMHGDVQLIGNRLQIDGDAINLAGAPREDVRAAIVELVARLSPDEAVAQLEAASRAIDARDDISPAEISQDIAQAFAGPRDLTGTERLKAIASNIAQQSAIGAAAGGLTTAVLAGLQAIGLT